MTTPDTGGRFMELPDDWLVVELAAIEAEIAAWPNGLKESFNSLFPDDPSMHIPLSPLATT